MPSVLVVGATRGLGAELVKQYAAAHYSVFGTSRKGAPTEPSLTSDSITWVSGIDISQPEAGAKIATALPAGTRLDVVLVTAGFFTMETFDEPDYESEVNMYRTVAVGPVFLVRGLVKAGALTSGAKVLLLSSEAGSIALRGNKPDGGGLYGHHASKAALNMVGKLLANDLRDKEIAVGLVHPGFMRTELTKSVGFDKAWDSGGAVTPDVAAKSLLEWIDAEFSMSKTGQFWAPRGPADIGTIEEVLGPKGNLPTPLELPW